MLFFNHHLSEEPTDRLKNETSNCQDSFHQKLDSVNVELNLNDLMLDLQLPRSSQMVIQEN